MCVELVLQSVVPEGERVCVCVWVAEDVFEPQWAKGT